MIGEPPRRPLVMTYFHLLYGKTDLELLEMFQDGGGAIYLEDQYGDLNVDNIFALSPNTMETEIEEDLENPVIAANYLWSGLRQLAPLDPMQEEMDPGEDLDHWIAAMRQRAPAAAKVAATGAHLYISGIGVVNEGADWVLTISELSEGNWEAAIGFLPVAAASLPALGKVILKTPGGTVLSEFNVAMVNAVNLVTDLPKTIAARIPVLQAAGATPQQMRAFIKAVMILILYQVIPKSYDRRCLAQAVHQRVLSRPRRIMSCRGSFERICTMGL